MTWLNAGMRRQDIVGGVVHNQWVVVQPSGAHFSTTNHNDTAVYLNGVSVDPLLAVYSDMLNVAGAVGHPLNGRLGEYISVAAASAAPVAGEGTLGVIEPTTRGAKIVVGDSVGKSIAEWDSRTGKTVAYDEDLGNHALFEDAWDAILDALEVTASATRGIGPFTDSGGGIWRIRLPDCTVMYTPPAGVEAPHPAGAWGWELESVPAHDRVYHRGCYTTNFMYPDAGAWPEYDPAEFSLAGTTADGRLPSSNALPPTDSPDGTFGPSMNYYHSTWTRGTGGAVLRDGVPFLNATCDNFLAYDDGLGLNLYWVLGTTWVQFVPGNAATALPGDPRAEPPLSSAVVTTGSITSGTSNLVVANRTGFNVGDWIIGEIGQEPGAGLRGTKGVGGNWPSDDRGYPTLGAAQSAFGATPADPGVYIWINNPSAGNYGDVYWGRSVGWIWIGDLNWGAITNTGDYYNARLTPRSLQAQIASITPGSGTTATFALENGPTDGVAKVTVSGMTVYRDEIVEINNALTTSNVQLTPGDHILGGVIHITNESGRILEGATSNRDDTWLITPKGVPCAGIDIYQSPNTIIRNLTLEGNWRLQGFGFNYGDGPAPHFEIDRGVVHAHDFGYSISVGIRANPSSHNTEFRNVQTIDLPLAHFATAFVNNVWAYDCDAKYTNPLMQYMQWAFYWADTSGGGGVRCTCSGPYMFPGFEGFKANNVSYIDCGGIGTMSMNGTAGWLIQNFHGVYPAGSCVNTPTGISHQQPIVNINNNIGRALGDLTPGGHIDGMIIDQQGYVFGGNTTMAVALKIMPTNPNVLVEGFENFCPNYVAGAPHQGAQAVESSGANAVVKNSTFHGRARWTAANNQENGAVVYMQNHNAGACTGLSLPDDPSSKFYF